MLAHYDFVSKDTLAYFSQRPPQAKRDADFALGYAIAHAKTRADQDLVIKALEFKCAVLWSQLDALWSAYVDRSIPPGAWAPGGWAPWSGIWDGRSRARRGGVNETAQASGAIPRLPRGVRLKLDETRGEWLLLAPERVVKLDAIAVAILQRCDGAATIEAIVDDLAATYAADRARIDEDVRALLNGLAAKRMVDL